MGFDDVDFAERPHVPDSTWPFGHEEIRQWYAEAAEHLLCGHAGFTSTPKKLTALGSDAAATSLERWSTQPRLALVHRDRIERSERITLCLNSTVVDLDLGDDGRAVRGGVVRSLGHRLTVKAQRVILAGGGIETTRLLLAVQRRWTGHFGGVGGPLGRYYMGHISGKIASIVLAAPDTVGDLDFTLDATGTYVRSRFTISAEAQLRHKLLNTAFWIDNPPFYDPNHRNAVLSAVFLALAFPPMGRQLLPEAIRLIHVGPKPYPVRAHMLNVVAGAHRGAKDMLHILRDRFLTRPRKPGFILRNRGGQYALHYHAEQEPNPDSRVVLTSETDRFGLPRVSIDFRYTNRDVESVIRSHEVLDAALRRHGTGRLEYWHSPSETPIRVLAQASDGVHQVGTTRMGRNPRESVVDPDLKAHDLANLYVASSSVFPSTGQANSTFVATALAIRLAHHLRSKASRETHAVMTASQ